MTFCRISRTGLYESVSQLAILELKSTQQSAQGCSPKKEVWGRLKQDLDKDFFNKLGLHTRTLIQVRKIATADLWSCPATTRV